MITPEWCLLASEGPIKGSPETPHHPDQIWYQTEFRLVLNQSEKCNFNPYIISFYKIRNRVLYVQTNPYSLLNFKTLFMIRNGVISACRYWGICIGFFFSPSFPRNKIFRKWLHLFRGFKYFSF